MCTLHHPKLQRLSSQSFMRLFTTLELTKIKGVFVLLGYKVTTTNEHKYVALIQYAGGYEDIC